MSHDDQEHACDACALHDIAVAEPHGLVDMDDLRLAKAVVSGIAPRLSTQDLLERIGMSQFPVELLQYLPHVYGPLYQELRPIAELLLECGNDYFDGDALRGFADVYWSNVVRERILRKDFDRAYSEVKKAFRGMRQEHPAPSEDFLTTPTKHGSPENLAASLECVCRLVHELHAAMCGLGIVPDVLATPTHPNHHMDSKTPGIMFATGVRGYAPHRRPTFTLVGLQVVSIATTLNKQRNDQLTKARERRLQSV